MQSQANAGLADGLAAAEKAAADAAAAANAAAAAGSGLSFLSMIPGGKQLEWDYVYDGCSTPGFQTYPFTANPICQPVEFAGQAVEAVADAANQLTIAGALTTLGTTWVAECGLDYECY